MVYIISIFSTIILFNSFYDASVLSELVQSHGIGSFKPVELFRYLPVNPSSVSLEGYIQKGTYLKLDKKAVTQILAQHPENILFKIPVNNNSSIEFELVRSQVLSDNFNTASLEGTVNGINYSPGNLLPLIMKEIILHGALSVFDDFVMMVASGKEGGI